MPRDYGSLTKSLSNDRTRLVDFSAELFSVPKIAGPPPLRNRKSLYSSGKFVFFVFSPREGRKSFTLKMAQAGLQRLLNMFLHLHSRHDPRVRSIRLGQKVTRRESWQNFCGKFDANICGKARRGKRGQEYENPERTLVEKTRVRRFLYAGMKGCAMKCKNHKNCIAWRRRRRE